LKKYLLLGVLGFFLVFLICGSASAANITVGPGHTYKTINQAITASHAGDTIEVYDNNGTAYIYNENVVVNKDNLTLTAKGKVTVNSTGTGPNNWFNFQLQNTGITIQNFIIQGDGTTYGVYAYQNETIKGNTFMGHEIGVRISEGYKDVIINNIFLNNDEAVYMDDSSKCTFTGNTIKNGTTGVNSQGNDHYIISHNTFQNLTEGMFIDGDQYSNIIYNAISNIKGNGVESGFGMDVMCDNNDQIKYNTISSSVIGIYIRGVYDGDFGTPCAYNTFYRNTLNNCKTGIQLDDAVNNTITYNSIKQGLTLLRSTTNGILLKGASNNTIEYNSIAGNSFGMLVNDYVYGKVSVRTNNNNTVNYNNIANNGIGIQFSTKTPTGNLINYNRIINANYEVKNYSNNTIDVRYNWWGSNLNPSSRMYGSVNVSPWIILSLTASPSLIKSGETSNITADMLHDSNGNYHDPVMGHVPDGIRVNFSTTLGSISSPVNLVSGTALSTLSGGSINGIANVSATADNQTVQKSVTIDTLSPKISSSNPVNSAINVPTNITIKVHFSERVKAGNMNITLIDSQGKSIAFASSIKGNILTIKPENTLSKGLKYAVTLHTGSLTDNAGNNLALCGFRFTTTL
jgi:parallel beta-helix repeat protein